jgi:hypothetical protein
MQTVDQTTLYLFSPFERECADPTRHPIKGFTQFQKFIDSRNGLLDCYCDLYAHPFNGVIDKIYFDFDGVINGMEQALPYAQAFYRFLVGVKKLKVIPVASGKKGFNLYVILKEQSYPNAKQLLRDVSYSLIMECFGKVTQIAYIDKEGREHPTLAKINENGEIGEIICIDPKIIGDVRRFSRIPNTLRPPKNHAYCTYLDPNKFPKMSISEVYYAIRHENTYNYNLRTSTTLGDIEIVHTLDTFSKSNINKKTQHFSDQEHNNSYLGMAIRPCLFRCMISPEPRHDVRVATTAELISSGFSNEEILNMYQKLKWVDFDPELTRYQIEHCKPIPYSKRKLKEIGVCYNCGRNCK